MRATITAGSWRCQPAPLPSAHLAAGAGIVAAGKLRVEQAATGLVKKVITPAGEVATEILGVGAAALARAASLTAGLLLISNNSKDDQGYKGEWAFNKLNSPFTDKDRTRLAYLEQEQEHRALSTDEQAELFVLLTRVKGVHGQKPKELEIYIAPEDKIDRSLLNPPIRHGNAPTFKEDNTSVEIHYEGQNPEGPFKEMHWQDHRGKGNDKTNHPEKTKPSRVNRDGFEKSKRRYWKKEYPKN